MPLSGGSRPAPKPPDAERPNEGLRAGARYGMIKLGSRTDVLMPAGEPMEVLVKAGDRVKGGATILLRFRNGAAEPGA